MNKELTFAQKVLQYNQTLSSICYSANYIRKKIWEHFLISI